MRLKLFSAVLIIAETKLTALKLSFITTSFARVLTSKNCIYDASFFGKGEIIEEASKLKAHMTKIVQCSANLLSLECHVDVCQGGCQCQNKDWENDNDNLH